MSSSTPLGYKLLQSVAGVACLLVASFGVMALAGHLDTKAAAEYCDDAVVNSVTSPNGHWLAEVHYSNCGLHTTKQWNSYLHLQDLHSGKTYHRSVVFAGRQDELHLEWSPNQLNVAGGNLAELQRVEQPEGLQVQLAEPFI